MGRKADGNVIFLLQMGFLQEMGIYWEMLLVYSTRSLPQHASHMHPRAQTHTQDYSMSGADIHNGNITGVREFVHCAPV